MKPGNGRLQGHRFGVVVRCLLLLGDNNGKLAVMIQRHSPGQTGMQTVIHFFALFEPVYGEASSGLRVTAAVSLAQTVNVHKIVHIRLLLRCLSFLPVPAALPVPNFLPYI